MDLTAVGIVLIVYGLAVAGVGYFKPEGIWKLVKMKLGRKTKDQTTQIILYVVAVIAIVVGIILL
jgi:uncharacterized membrane protein YidH (DUF202 family)